MDRGDSMKIFIMGNMRDKKEIRIEAEGTRELIGIKPDIHIRVHKK